MSPLAVEAVGDDFVAVGSTASGIGGRSVTATSPDGVGWAVAEADSRPGALLAIGHHLDDILAAGGRMSGDGRDRAMLLASAEGAVWQTISSPRFRDSWFSALAVSDGLVLLTGWRRQGERTVPFSLWSADLEAFLRGRFPKPSEKEGGRVNAATFSADGSVAVAVGALESARPVIWFSEIELPWQLRQDGSMAALWHVRLTHPELDSSVDVRRREFEGRWLAVADLADEPDVGTSEDPREALRRSVLALGTKLAGELAAGAELGGPAAPH
ncbi:MAG: hypothetical protein ACC726_11030 [Chloroflexota bacterium]